MTQQYQQINTAPGAQNGTSGDDATLKKPVKEWPNGIEAGQIDNALHDANYPIIVKPDGGQSVSSSLRSRLAPHMERRAQTN
eukprot:4391673-Amphidinium_carterae.1